MQDGEDEKGNGVKGEEMGQGVEQKVLEGQADQIPKMEKQVVLGKNKPEKKVKKRKWWHRRQKVEMQVAPRDLVEEPEQVILKDQRRKPVKKVVLVFEIEMKKIERQVDPVEKPDQVMKKVERQVAPLNLVEEPEQVILKDQGKEQVKNRVRLIENKMKKLERQVDPVEKPDQVMKKVERQMAQFNLVEEPEQVILKEQVKNRVRFIENEMKAERQVDPVEKPDQVMKKEERQVDPVKKPDQVMKKTERQVALLNLVEEPEQVILKEQVKNRVRFIENEMKAERQVDPVEKPDQVMKKAERQVALLNLVEEPEQVILKEQVKNRVCFIENEMKKAERQVDSVEKPDQVMKKAERQVDPVDKPDQVMKKAERQVALLNLVEEPEQVILKEQVKNRVRFIENEMKKADRQVDPVEKPDQVMKKAERQVDPVEKTDQVMKKAERQVALLNLVEEPEQVILKEQVKNRIRFIENEMRAERQVDPVEKPDQVMKKVERQVDPVEKPDQVMKKTERQVALLNLVEEPEQVILKEQVKNRDRFIENEMKKAERQVDPVEKPDQVMKKVERQVDPVEKTDQVMKKAERQVALLNLVEEPEQVILKEQVKNRIRFIENEMRAERQVDPVEKPDQVMKKVERQVDPVEKPDQVMKKTERQVALLNLVEEPEQVILKEQVKNRDRFIENEMKKAERQVDPVEKPDKVMKKAERQVDPVEKTDQVMKKVERQLDPVEKPDQVMKKAERQVDPVEKPDQVMKKAERQVALLNLVEEPEQVILKEQVKNRVRFIENEMKKAECRQVDPVEKPDQVMKKAERQVDPVEKTDQVMKKAERQVALLNLVEEPEQVILKEQVKNRIRFIENEMRAERQVDPVEKPDQVMKKVERQVDPVEKPDQVMKKTERQVALLNLVEEPEQVILKEQVKNRDRFIENEMKKAERQVDPVEKPDQVMKKVERQVDPVEKTDQVMKKAERQVALLNLVEEPEQVILKEQVKNRIRFIENEMRAERQVDPVEKPDQVMKKVERQVDPVEKPDQVMKKTERQVALLNLVEEPEQVILKEQVKNRDRFIENEMKKAERQVDPVEKPDKVMKKAERQVDPVEKTDQVMKKVERQLDPVEKPDQVMKKAERQVDPVEKPDQVMKKAERQVALLNLVEEPEQVILKEQVKNRVRFIENEMKKAECRQVDPVEKPDQVMKKAERQVDPVEKTDQVMKKAERQVALLNLVEEPEQVILKEQVKNRIRFIENEMRAERQVDPVEKPDQVMKKVERQVDPVEKPDQVMKKTERQVALLNLVEEPEQVILKEQVKNRDRFIENEMKKAERQVDPVEKPDKVMKKAERQVAPVDTVEKPKQVVKNQIDIKKPNLEEQMVLKILEKMENKRLEKQVLQMDQMTKVEEEQLQDDVLVPPIVEAQPGESGKESRK
ncbi:titin-like isoform X1 [Trichomycterus rosablanca]|uniref:titin-like isoform X1 n=1 Tax=Trichomycterus rosablanca TaxID=2290929 RepID=UPI002F355115